MYNLTVDTLSSGVFCLMIQDEGNYSKRISVDLTR